MSAKGRVYQKGRLAGILEKKGNEYIFVYDDSFLQDENTKSISLTLPKKKKKFKSPYLFSFFFGLLAEGIAKEIQCKKLKIDPDDHFQRLLKTTKYDTTGSVTIEEINE